MVEEGGGILFLVCGGAAPIGGGIVFSVEGATPIVGGGTTIGGLEEMTEVLGRCWRGGRVMFKEKENFEKVDFRVGFTLL